MELHNDTLDLICDITDSFILSDKRNVNWHDFCAGYASALNNVYHNDRLAYIINNLESIVTKSC